MNRQRGVGLAEVLISLFLASLVLVMITQHYTVIAQQSRRFQGVVGEKTELLQVVAFLRERIRHAGFLPCVSLNQMAAPPVAAITISTQSLTLRGMSPVFHEGVGHYGSGEKIIIADCVRAVVRRTTEGIDCTRFCHTGELLEERFYMGKDSRGQRALMYAAKHPEVLSTAVSDLEVSEHHAGRVHTVQVILTLARGEKITTVTRVRA